jgi:hypothetical protein
MEGGGGAESDGVTGLDSNGASRRRNGSTPPHRSFSDTTAIDGLSAKSNFD